MSKFPIICGIIDKKLYLTILLALIIIIQSFGTKIPKGNNCDLINSFVGCIFEMLSVFIPQIFKFKGDASTRKCSKILFRNYFILFLIILLDFGFWKILATFELVSTYFDVMWIVLCFQMIIYFLLSIVILKTKYYIHHIISSILFCIFTVVIDCIFNNFKGFKPFYLLSLITYLFYNLQYCHAKYMFDKKYHSYWNILFFIGLFYFIMDIIDFLIIIIKDPYNNSVFKTLRTAEAKYLILNIFLEGILGYYLRILIILLIVDYFSYHHVLISHVLYRIVTNFINIFINYDENKNHLFFLIPVVFQILSLLFFLEILEFNFCKLNRNTKRNIMLREEDDMLFRTNTNMSEIEVDNDLIIKNQKMEREYELHDMEKDYKEKDKDDENNNTNVNINFE